MIRRLKLAVAILLPAIFLSPSSAHAGGVSRCGPAGGVNPAAILPYMTVCANGKQYDIAGIRIDGKFALLQPVTVVLGSGASFTVGASFNSDPFANFTFGSVIPTGFGPVTFNVFFGTPVVGGPYNHATANFTSTISLTTAVGAGPGTGIISLGILPTYLTGSTDLGTLGVDVGTGTCTISTPGSIACPPGNSSNTFAPISPTQLDGLLSYTHNTTGVGSSSQVNFSGGVELTTSTVPEPASVVMMGVGLLLVGGALRQRRKES